MRHLAENCVSDADVDAFGSPYSDQLGHLNIIMVMVVMVMMVVMVVMMMMVMIVERGVYGGFGGEWTFLEKTAQKEKVHEDGGVYILSVVTELMKSKELNCANYHRNELWPGGL